MRVLITLMFAALILTPIAGCGTVEGVGKDVSSTSRWVKEKVF